MAVFCYEERSELFCIDSKSAMQFFFKLGFNICVDKKDWIFGLEKYSFDVVSMLGKYMTFCHVEHLTYYSCSFTGNILLSPC